MLSGGVHPVIAAMAPSNPVTLNLFQGPSSGLGRWDWVSARGAVAFLNKAPREAATWILKQVQDDEEVSDILAPAMEFIR